MESNKVEKKDKESPTLAEIRSSNFMTLALCLTILGVIDLIGIFWGKDGFHMIGQAILGGLVLLFIVAFVYAGSHSS